MEVNHNVRINGCQILQPGIEQLPIASSFMAAGMHLSYVLRQKFANLDPPHEPASGMPLVDPYEWQKQLTGRGFSTSVVGLLLSEACRFSDVPLRNGGRVKVLDFGCVGQVEDDGSLSISVVSELLARYGSMIGILKIHENYTRQPKQPYLVEKGAKHLSEHAVVVLGYCQVAEGAKLCKSVPPGSYYIVQDSLALSKVNPLGMNMVDCSHLIEGYVADPDFPYSGL